MTPLDRKRLNKRCLSQIMGYMTDEDFLGNTNPKSRLDYLSSLFQVLPKGKGLNAKLPIVPKDFDDIDTLVGSSRNPKDSEIFSMRLGGKLATFLSWEQCEIGRTINHLMTGSGMTYEEAKLSAMDGCNVFHIESAEWFKDLDTAVIFAMQFNMKNKTYDAEVHYMIHIAEFIKHGFGK